MHSGRRASSLRRGALCAGLVLGALARCGPRSDAGGAAPVPPPPTPTAAEPPLALPSAPAGAVQRGACTFGDRRTLGTDPVIGVYVDPGTNEVSVVSAAGTRIERRALDPSDGTLQSRSTVLLPPGAEPTLAWRMSSGELAIAYRGGNAFHLMRGTGSTSNEATPLLRYGLYDYGGDVEHWLGPLDDPNNSRYVGVAIGQRSANGRTFGGSLCVTDTAGMRAVRCQTTWANAAPLRSVHPASGGTVLQIVHGRSYAGAEAQAPVGLTQNSYNWVGYGPASTGGTTTPPLYGFGRRGATVERHATADLTRGGVFLAMAPVTGLAFYAEFGGPLRVQLLDAFAQPVLDPVAMPFVTARWVDATYAYGEIFATLVSLADEEAQPHTTTLVRLYPTLPADAPITMPPQRAPLADARVIPMREGELLLYSLTERAALVARCGVIAP